MGGERESVEIKYHQQPSDWPNISGRKGSAFQKFQRQQVYRTPVYMPALEKRDETGHYLLMKHYWCVSFWRLTLEISHQTEKLTEEVIKAVRVIRHIDSRILWG